MRKAGYVYPVLALFFILTGCESQHANSSGLDGFAGPSVLPSEVSTEIDEQESKSMAGDASGAALTDTSTLEDYLAYAALNNPGLESAFNRWKAASAQIPQVTSLPEPRFTYRYYIEQVETRVGAQKQAFGISQTFPWFDKLKLKGDAAESAALMARQQYEAAKLKLFFQVKDAYYEYYYLGRAVEIAEENIALLKNFESVVRTRYQAATAKHPDVIRTQVELGKLEDRLKTLRDLQKPIAARLNAALNRPPESPVARPVQITEETISLPDSRILELMGRSNPELMALRYDIAQSRTAIDLAQKDYYPDVTFGVDFIDTSDRIGPNPPGDSGQDPVIAMVSVNLPIWREKLDAGVRQARYQYNAAARTQTEQRNRLNAQVKLVLFQFRDAERKIDLYRDTLLPKAIESVKANEASFRSGGSTFLEVIDAQRILLEFELAYERALSGKAQRLAELEMLVGAELRRGEDVIPDSPPMREQEK